MCTASEATTAIGVDASGEIDDMVTGFGQNPGSKYADITVFAIKIKVAGSVLVKMVRIVLPGFEGKVDGGWQMFLLIVFRSTQINEKTARVGRESMQIVDSQRV